MDVVVIGFDIDDINNSLCNNITCISIDDINKNKADILIINLDNMDDLYNEISYYDSNKYLKYDLYEYDRVNRLKYKNYNSVYIVSLDNMFDKYKYKNIYSNIIFINNLDEINYLIQDNNKKISNIKNNNINKLKEYVDKQNNYFSSKDIMNLFKVSNRWIKRYMKDMNDIYNNIGYSYSKRKWYKVKGR